MNKIRYRLLTLVYISLEALTGWQGVLPVALKEPGAQGLDIPFTANFALHTCVNNSRVPSQASSSGANRRVMVDPPKGTCVVARSTVLYK